MSVQKQVSAATLAMSVSMVLGGCMGTEEIDPGSVDSQPHRPIPEIDPGYNGQQYNGQQYNGLGWIGSGPMGQGYEGLGYESSPTPHWEAIGLDGQGGFLGPSWGGDFPVSLDCTPSNNNPSCTTLHNWVNHSDQNGNSVVGYPYDQDDIEQRVTTLSYWVRCACPSDVSIPFSDTHGTVATTLHGSFGLATTWCSGSAGTTVPEAEMQRVSACLLSLVNTKGKHYPLSIRSTEPGTAMTTNEALVEERALALFFGNVWKAPHVDEDTTTPPSGASQINSGGVWWNQERFSCSLGDYSLGQFEGFRTYNDQWAMGRDCEFSNCNNHVSFLGMCSTNSKAFGNVGAWDPNNPSQMYSKGVETSISEDPAVPGVLALSTVGSSLGGSTISDVAYRGRNWYPVAVYAPESITIENPTPTFPTAGGHSAAIIESGTIGSGQSVMCAGTSALHCEALSSSAPGKLIGLVNSQVISVNYTANLPPPNNRAGDPSEAMTIAIRYSQPTLLGDGQCDPDAGCSGTIATMCASGVSGPSGCVGGTATPGKLRMLVNNKMMNTSYQLVQGSNSPYGKNIFVPTGDDDKYGVAYVYPIYMQDSGATIPGLVDYTPGRTEYDTLRVFLRGDSRTPTDAPGLDTAYFIPGPPPADADCKGRQGCWLYAGPAQTVTQDNNTQFVYTSPTLPAGTYTFQLTDMTGDLDLYVKANATAGIYNWDCRPYAGPGTSETCSVTLTSAGYVSVMVNGYAPGPSTATLLGRN